jgi:RND family efflux transporter MFP subunit
VLLAGCGGARGEQDTHAIPTPVIVRAVSHVDRPEYLLLSGDVEGFRTINLGFLVPGLVRTVAAREGDAVTAGQLLAALDPTDYQLNLEMAAAQRERAEQELARANAMFAEHAVSENDLQKAQVAVRIARAQEAMANKKLGDTRLLSPITGILARRAIEPFEQAGPGMPVFTVVQIEPVLIRVGVPESEIERFAVGQRAVVTLPSLSGDTVVGRVRLVGIAADPASRTYPLKIAVPNAGGRLRPGMIAEVRVESTARLTMLTLPGEAVVRAADQLTRVFVYDPAAKRVHARRVEVGAAYGTEIEIRGGLAEGDLVVVGGQHRLQNGALVEPQTPVPPARAAPRSE